MESDIVYLTYRPNLNIVDGRIAHKWASGFTYTFCGFITQQHPAIFPVFEKIFTENRDIKRIIEIGTAYGGLSIYFGVHALMLGGEVLTIDINKKQLSDKWFLAKQKFDITFRQSDVFDEKIIEEIKEFIKDERTLLFCDGGNKIKEFNYFTKLLKPNDIIMAHDWGYEIKKENVNQETWDLVEPFYQNYFDDLGTAILSCKIR